MDFDGNIISESSLFKIFYYNSTMTYGDEHLWLVDGYDIYKIDPLELSTLVSYRVFNNDINACHIGAIEHINGEIFLTSCREMYKFKPD